MENDVQSSLANVMPMQLPLSMGFYDQIFPSSKNDSRTDENRLSHNNANIHNDTAYGHCGMNLALWTLNTTSNQAYS